MKAYKNRAIGTANNWREQAIFITLLLMLASLLISRAVLSVSSVLFVGLAVLHKEIALQIKTVFSTPLYFSLSFLLIIPFVSGLWSSDAGQWLNVVRLKLPLLFFPLAFAGTWRLSQRQWHVIAFAFLLINFIGCMGGLWDYLQHMKATHEQYLQAKTIWAPLDTDHVRFSWMVCVAVMLCLLLTQIASLKKHRVFFYVAAFFFIVYLHVLSARTGLFALYLFLLLYAGNLLLQAKNRRWSVSILAMLIALPFVAYSFLPTFRARIRYNLYDLSFVKKSEYLPGTSDGARVLSLKGGWQMLQQHPLGVGAGDVANEQNRWYAANVPQILESDKLNPCSEWLMYGGFAGWPGLCVFSLCMVVPFFVRPKQFRIYWVGLAATAAFSFLFDMGLEVQYGIFLYAFLTCWWWRWFQGDGQKEKTDTLNKKVQLA